MKILLYLIVLHAGAAIVMAGSTPAVEMVEVEGGTFAMGAVDRKAGQENDELPQRQITVGDFAIQKAPVTQALWRNVMGTNPSEFKADDLPVQNVTFFDAMQFCNRLSELYNLKPVYRDHGGWAGERMRIIFADPEADGFRLPTEAEFEFAARGGAKSKSTRFPGGNDATQIGWHRDNSQNRVQPVGQKQANELGLYDMSGNVLQWCYEAYSADAYRGVKLSEPSLNYKEAIVTRGGCYWSREASLRVTARYPIQASRAFPFVGFRVARGPNPELKPRWEQADKYLKNPGDTKLTARPHIPDPSKAFKGEFEIPPAPTTPLGPIPTAEVKLLNGAPTLYINGKPDTGLMIWRHAAKGEGTFSDFRQAGINLVQPDLGLSWAFKYDGSFDRERVDGVFNDILKGNPDALVMPRVHVHAPAWWMALHPGHQLHGYAPGPDRFARGDWDFPSFSDELWKRDMGKAVRTLVRYVEEHHGDHVIGYLIGAGDTGEWSPGWVNGGEFDFHPSELAAYRKWLRDDNAEIPRDRLRGRPAAFFNDPGNDKDLISYSQFASESMADTVLFFAKEFREATREMNRQRVLGGFLGYKFAMYNRMPHHDFNRILASPDIDFIGSLSNYPWRGPGGLYASTTSVATVRQHGKLLWNEEDSATPLSTRVPKGMGNRYGPADWWETQQLSVHKIVGSWIEGGTSWYMDWLGEDWYRNPDIMSTIAATQKLLQSQINADRRSVAQVAVFSSEKAVARIRPESANLELWRTSIREPLLRLGAPHDFYDLADLDAAVATGQYKLLVFVDVEPFDTSRLPKDLAVLWTYLPGLSEADASRMMGIAIKTAAPRKESPRLIPAVEPGQPDELESFAPGVWRKGNTFWQPAPPVKLADLRKIADAAGVHCYAPAGDQVLANASMLMIHSASEGAKTIRLPRPARVVEAFSGKVVGESINEFTVDLKLGQTAVWAHEPAK